MIELGYYSPSRGTSSSTRTPLGECPNHAPLHPSQSAEGFYLSEGVEVVEVIAVGC